MKLVASSRSTLDKQGYNDGDKAMTNAPSLSRALIWMCFILILLDVLQWRTITLFCAETDCLIANLPDTRYGVGHHTALPLLLKHHSVASLVASLP